MEKVREQSAGIVTMVLLAAAVYLVVRQQLSPAAGPRGAVTLAELPTYAFLSFTRMLIAYLFSLVFSLLYGLTAALKKGADQIMLPVLDVLQSVPVLGFFPAAVFFFITLFPGRLGVEAASIFLIFTSQAWNMTFGVYESIQGIPKDLRAAGKVYEIKGRQALRKLYLPAAANRLVYNSILSWAGGWYFLVATEIIATGSTDYRLPGLGSFLVITSAQGRIAYTLIGLAVLITIIILMDVLLWRPLTVWSEKFRYEFAAGAVAERHHSIILDFFNRLRYQDISRRLIDLFKALTFWPWRGLRVLFDKWLSFYRARPALRRAYSYSARLLYYSFFALLAYLLYFAVKALWEVVSGPFPSQAELIPLATLSSMGRLLVAYLFSLLWTVPAAVKIAGSRRAARWLRPFFEVTASIPATALFPLIVLFVITYTGSVNLAAVLLVLTGMQWYLLFNLISGADSIPADLREVAATMRLKGWLYWRRLVLPAIFPSLITGSVTAWGGGWNALIVAEYFKFGHRTFSVFGIGAFLDRATYIRTDAGSQMILYSLVFMVATIMVLNRFFWRPLYNLAIKKFKLEY